MVMNFKKNNVSEKIVAIFLLIILIPSVLLYWNNYLGHTSKIEEGILTVAGIEMKISDIEKIEILDNLDIERKINGTSTYRYSSGTFIVTYNKRTFKVNMNIYNKVKKYIEVQVDGCRYIFNEKTDEDTLKLYDSIEENNHTNK